MDFRTNLAGSALFIGNTYLDVEMLADRIPHGDEKILAHDYVVSFGGNAVTSAFAVAKLGFLPDLISTRGDDWMGIALDAMTKKYRLYWHPRLTKRSSVSVIMPIGSERSIVRYRDEEYLHDFAKLNLDGCRLVHVDGLQTDAALFYLREARARGICTSLDAGSTRAHMEEILSLTDIAVVSVRLASEMGLNSFDMLDALRKRGCRVGAVTRGEGGMYWYAGEDDISEMPALPVPSERIVDTSGAGDVFHGGYIYSLLTWPEKNFQQHFHFARAAAAYAIQRLGNEASLPTVDDVWATQREFGLRFAA